MLNRTLDPAGLPVMGTPNYTHGMVTSEVSEWLTIAGQVGVRPDGTTAEGTFAQCEQAFANIGGLLREAGMGPENLCHLRIFLIDRADIPDLRAARSAFLGPDLKVPSTLVIVSGLVDPAWRVELEIVAAK